MDSGRGRTCALSNPPGSCPSRVWAEPPEVVFSYERCCREPTRFRTHEVLSFDVETGQKLCKIFARNPRAVESVTSCDSFEERSDVVIQSMISVQRRTTHSVFKNEVAEFLGLYMHVVQPSLTERVSFES